MAIGQAFVEFVICRKCCCFRSILRLKMTSFPPDRGNSTSQEPSDPMFEEKSFSIASGMIGARFLRLLPPELAHDIGIRMLQRMPGVLGSAFGVDPAEIPSGLSSVLPGIGPIAHPIGLAAGFDKNAVALPGLAGLGFSFVEIGAVTPRPQAGNPKPRLFRYAEDRALINRMGFNNDGLGLIKSRLTQENARRLKCPLKCPIVVNIGKNRDTEPERAVDDYAEVFFGLENLASAFVANISSPNTPGLRQLANSEFLRRLADCLAGSVSRVWIKLDPDMDKETMQKVIASVGTFGFAGVVMTNTTMVTDPERGGMSGRPLFDRANQTLISAWEVHRGQLPVIGVGGVWSGKDVIEKIRLGADAVQIYTAFVYQGPAVIRQMIAEISAELHVMGVSSISELRGTHESLVH